MPVLSTGQSPPFPSPVSHLDEALGIEVMQFVDQAGGITQSFPNVRQLASYAASPDGVTAAAAATTPPAAAPPPVAALATAADIT